MNHRRSVAAVSIIAAVALAACGEVDDADTTPTTGRTPVSAVQVEQAALAEAKANAQLVDAWAYYYDVTHPEFKAATPARGPVSADAAEHRANFEARVAEAASKAAAEAEARGPVSADAAEHRATVELTVEHEVLRQGVDTKR